MALVIPALGENYFLSVALGKQTGENLYLRLYSNNYTPIGTTVVGDLTQCSIGGYSQKTITHGSGWGTVAQNGSNKAESSHSTETFTFSGSGTIHGWYLVNVTSGVLVAAEKFASARTVADTDVLNLNIALTIASEN